MPHPIHPLTHLLQTLSLPTPKKRASRQNKGDDAKDCREQKGLKIFSQNKCSPGTTLAAWRHCEIARGRIPLCVQRSEGLGPIHIARLRDCAQSQSTHAGLRDCEIAPNSPNPTLRDSAQSTDAGRLPAQGQKRIHRGVPPPTLLAPLVPAAYLAGTAV